MSEFENLSAALGVSLRPLRLSCHLTQRTLRYAEDAEKSSVYAVAVAIKYKVPATGAFELISHFMTFWFVSSLSTHEPAYYPDRFLARLEDEALVAGAAGGLFAVEVFEERDGVFA